jgi:hypothetical protein
VKPFLISPVFAGLMATSFAGLVLVAPVHEAQAGKGRSAGAGTAGAKFSAGPRTAPKLTCVGPHCRPRPGENRATSTGTNKAVANQGTGTWTAQGKASTSKTSGQDPTRLPGGVEVSGGTRRVRAAPAPCPRYPHRPCSPSWNSQPRANVRDHRGPRVVPKEDPRQKR